MAVGEWRLPPPPLRSRSLQPLTKESTVQFHHNGYVSEDPRVHEPAGYGVDAAAFAEGLLASGLTWP